ncbi:inositol-3-phosphate synthase, partial [Candidatus Bipolaricaulota bacterium]|nr:inositol-3-phosphate synthase [Candidatus Bipolaricaulota bacterium]
INCIPEFIVSGKDWGERFRKAGLPCAGDDIKSQVGATILHRTLAKLLIDRGVKLEESYQLNIGGNTDFLNMLEEERLSSKRVSKTEAVSSQVPYEVPLRIGPSDYVPFLKDNKVCYIYLRGRKFGDIPLTIDVKLSVEDSPNSAGVVIDAIRAVKLALDRGIAGPLIGVSAYFFKHPPVQIPDEQARQAVEDFIAGRRDN